MAEKTQNSYFDRFDNTLKNALHFEIEKVNREGGALTGDNLEHAMARAITAIKEIPENLRLQEIIEYAQEKISELLQSVKHTIEKGYEATIKVNPFGASGAHGQHTVISHANIDFTEKNTLLILEANLEPIVMPILTNDGNNVALLQDKFNQVYQLLNDHNEKYQHHYSHEQLLQMTMERIESEGVLPSNYTTEPSTYPSAVELQNNFYAEVSNDEAPTLEYEEDFLDFSVKEDTFISSAEPSAREYDVSQLIDYAHMDLVNMSSHEERWLAVTDPTSGELKVIENPYLGDVIFPNISELDLQKAPEFHDFIEHNNYEDLLPINQIEIESTQQNIATPPEKVDDTHHIKSLGESFDIQNLTSWRETSHLTSNSFGHENFLVISDPDTQEHKVIEDPSNYLQEAFPQITRGELQLAPTVQEYLEHGRALKIGLAHEVKAPLPEIQTAEQYNLDAKMSDYRAPEINSAQLSYRLEDIVNYKTTMEIDGRAFGQEKLLVVDFENEQKVIPNLWNYSNAPEPSHEYLSGAPTLDGYAEMPSVMNAFHAELQYAQETGLQLPFEDELTSHSIEYELDPV